MERTGTDGVPRCPRTFRQLHARVSAGDRAPPGDPGEGAHSRRPPVAIDHARKGRVSAGRETGARGRCATEQMSVCRCDACSASGRRGARAARWLTSSHLVPSALSFPHCPVSHPHAPPQVAATPQRLPGPPRRLKRPQRAPPAPRPPIPRVRAKKGTAGASLTPRLPPTARQRGGGAPSPRMPRRGAPRWARKRRERRKA